MQASWRDSFSSRCPAGWFITNFFFTYSSTKRNLSSFCTIDANIGVVTVPDNRLLTLESLVNPEKVIPATVEIVDIAGLVKGAS